MQTHGAPATTAPTAAQFSCPSCARRYSWKPSLAGRSARCACGATMLVPLNSPTPDDGLYDLVEPEERHQTARDVALAQPAPPPVAQIALRYENPKRAAAEAGDPRFPDRHIDLHLPLVLVIAGIVVHMGVAIVSGSRSPAGVMPQLASLGLEVVAGMAVSMAAVLIAVRFRGIELGNFWTALLKLAAVWLAPGAIVAVAAPLLWFIPGGGLIVFIAQFALYFALLGTMFKLDESDTWYCVSVIFIINVAIYFGLVAIG